MTPEEPKTRTEANQPEAVEHLSAEEQSALELGAEAEHADGALRERLDQKSRELTDEK